MPEEAEKARWQRAIPAGEVEIKAVRASGPGGQNVDKVASAIHLRFDIRASSLPQEQKERLLHLQDQRISKDGVIVIKAQRHRDQAKNIDEALSRLQLLLDAARRIAKKRLPTRPTASARGRRLESKARHSRLKALRQKTRTEAKE